MFAMLSGGSPDLIKRCLQNWWLFNTYIEYGVNDFYFFIN